MFCISRDGLFYLVLHNGVFAFAAGMFFTLLVLSVWCEFWSDFHRRRKARS